MLAFVPMVIMIVFAFASTRALEHREYRFGAVIAGGAIGLFFTVVTMLFAPVNHETVKDIEVINTENVVKGNEVYEIYEVRVTQEDYPFITIAKNKTGLLWSLTSGRAILYLPAKGQQ